MRESKITRKTAETDIELTLGLDGTGESRIETGCGFLEPHAHFVFPTRTF